MSQAMRASRGVSVGAKLAMATVGVLMVLSTFLYWERSAREREHRISSKRTAASMVADLFAATVSAPLDFGDDEAIEGELHNLERNPDISFAAVYSTQQRRQVGSIGRAAEVAPFAYEGASDSVVEMPDAIDVVRVVKNPIGKQVGVFEMKVSLRSENDNLGSARRRTFLVSFATAAATGLVLLLLARRLIIAPLARVIEGARSLERGDTHRQLAIDSHDELGELAHVFNAMGRAIAERELGLRAARQDLRDLFDNMQQAILAFGRGGLVRGEVSARAVQLFEKPVLEGTSVRALLYPTAPSHDVDAQSFEEWANMAFDMSKESWPSFAELCPREVMIPRPGGTMIPLELDFRPMWKGEGVDRVMLLATDVSEKRKLLHAVHSQEAEHARRMAAMRRLLAGGSQVFLSFLEGARDRLYRCIIVLGPSPAFLKSREIDEIFRHAHTLKGEAKAFDLRELEQEMLGLEEILDRLRGEARGDGIGLSASVHTLLLESIRRGQAAIEQGCEVFVSAAPTGRAALDQVTIQRKDLKALFQLVGLRQDALGDVVRRLASRPFGESTANLTEMAPIWAEKEGKKLRVEVEGRETAIPEVLARVLGGALTHLSRNAIAHGIERPDQRQKAGKPEVGLLRITAVETDAGPVITFEDDGGGLDVNRISEQAAGLGPDAQGQSAFDLVFVPGLSTALPSDTLSGRGVGLDAVRSDLQTASYTVTVTSEEGKGTSFLMAPVQKSPERSPMGKARMTS